jgi:hypothetical protein
MHGAIIKKIEINCAFNIEIFPLLKRRQNIKSAICTVRIAVDLTTAFSISVVLSDIKFYPTP